MKYKGNIPGPTERCVCFLTVLKLLMNYYQKRYRIFVLPLNSTHGNLYWIRVSLFSNFARKI